MSRDLIPWAIALLVHLASPAIAQDTATGEARTAVEPTVRGILEAILLPGLTQEARRAGIPEEDIAIVLDTSREQQLPPVQRREIFQSVTEIAREEGPIDNFGAFVQARLAEGLRGRALAEAIREEHRLRGKGKGKRPGDDTHPGETRGGRPEDAGAQGRGDEERGKGDRKRNEGKGGGS